jgi:hypothetical protein
VFVPDPRNPNSLSGVFVTALFKDRDGALWVAPADPESFAQDRVISLFADRVQRLPLAVVLIAGGGYTPYIG